MDEVKMTEAQAREFFAILYHGDHHVPKLKPWGEGWSLYHWGDLSTFDFDFLTRLVFLAHDRMVRVSIMGCTPKQVRIAIWQRKSRSAEARMGDRHPTLETALGMWRERHPETEVAP